jgi:SAM-dependent methyltransferase
MRLTYARHTQDFFGERPYPVDLGRVEARDGASDALKLLRAQLPAPPARILDLGCGHGRHAGPLQQAGYRLMAVDVSPACVRAARRRFPALEVRCADMTRMPFRDASFDGVYSFYSSLGLQGAPAAAALAEAARVTRAGGTLLVDVAGPAALFSAFTERVPEGGALVVRWRTPRHVHQRNLVLARGALGLYRLSYERLEHTLPRLMERHGWRVTDTWGGFHGEPPRGDSARLILCGERA